MSAPLARRSVIASPPMPSVHGFASHSQACAALAARVVADLDRALQLRGTASLAVPGGTTPDEFLALLGFRSLDWRRISVTLTDERWVPPNHARSNAGLVARTLGRSGRRYDFFPLWREGATAIEAVDRIEAESAALPWPLDVVVLGMGEDGHVASLFPGDEAGFGAAGTRRFAAVTGPGDEWRIGLTAHAIAQAGSVCLLIKGRPKLDILRAAVGGSLPIARVLAARNGGIDVYASD